MVNKFSDLSVHPGIFILFLAILLLREERNSNGGPIDIFKKDIIEYQNKWEILGTFVENGELSTEKNDEGYLKCRIYGDLEFIRNTL